MIRRRITVPANPERVWEAMTDPEQIPGWFGGEMRWELEPGGRLDYRGEDGEQRRGTVEEVRPGQRLRFVWWPSADSGEGGHGGRPEGPPEASEVTYLIQPAPEGTVLTVQERAVPVGGPVARASAAPAGGAGAGWDDWDSRLAGAWSTLSSSALTGARY